MCSIGAIHHPPIEVGVFLHFLIKEPILTFELSKIIGVPEYRLEEALHKCGFKLTIEE